MSKASLNLSLSSTGFDEDTQEFHVSLDRALFKDPVTIISTVLEANGFSINLENILACLDQLKVGVLAKLNARGNQPYPIAKAYLPCFYFKLPSKNQVGFTLKRFYQEIEHYELAISELQEQSQQPIRRKPKPKESESEKLIALEEENKLLKKEVEDLKIVLSRAVKSEASATQALASQNLLPNNIRLGVVRELNIEDRQIILKSGRKTISISMAMSNILPNIEDKCLVHYVDGSPKACFFYESTGIALRPILSKIIAMDSQIIKVRDLNRRTWCIPIRNEEEAKEVAGLKDGDHLQIYIVDNHVIRIEALVPQKADFVSLTHEELSRQQIVRAQQLKDRSQKETGS